MQFVCGGRIALKMTVKQVEEITLTVFKQTIIYLSASIAEVFLWSQPKEQN